MNQFANELETSQEILGEQLGPSYDGPEKTRLALFRRLQDVVGLPSSRISPQERHMAADLLIEMLREADVTTRVRCAERISLLHDAPALLLRFLGRDVIEVARPLFEVCQGFNDSDLIAVTNSPNITEEHRILIAGRKVVSEVVADALAEFKEYAVCRTLLKNEGAKLAHPATEIITAMSKSELDLVPLLLKRPELKPSQALTMFWWADDECRKRILQRFAVERLTLLETAQDLFPRAAKDGWQDSLVRKSLQFIERRQRNRAAAERSEFGSLEGAIEALEREFNTHTLKEISFLAGIKPACGAQILSDPSGEAIAILCKATGLKRFYLRALWRGLRRPLENDGEPNPAFVRTSLVFDSISTNRAQTVLRYWNWALTSAMSPMLAANLEENDEIMDFSVSARMSHLVFGNQ